MAKFPHETQRCPPARERFFHLGVDGADDRFSTLLLAGCEAVGQNALQHEIGCDKAACILHKLPCQTAEFLEEIW